MDTSTIVQMLSTGDLEGVINQLPSDDTITDTMSCPCGTDNALVLIRIGRTLFVWDNVSLNHGDPSTEMIVRAHATVEQAVETMDKFRSDIAAYKGLTQLQAAVAGPGGTGDFMVI